MIKTIYDCLGVKKVEVYEKNGAFFLKITFNAENSKGDVYEYVVDGVELGIKQNDEVVVNFNKYISETIYNGDVYCPMSACIPHFIKIGKQTRYNLNYSSRTTAKCIAKHTITGTLSELEDRLGCHIKIIDKKE